MSEDLTFRPITDADVPFLYDVYASTRQEELAPLLEWSDQQKAEFLHMQFTAQHRYYQEQYGDARFEIIVRNGEPIGRLYVQRLPDQIHIIDIALLPPFRRLGIGTRLLTDLLHEGDARRVPVRIYVERQNPALRLYERLGFIVLQDLGIYLFLERPPAPVA